MTREHRSVSAIPGPREYDVVPPLGGASLHQDAPAAPPAEVFTDEKPAP